MRTIAHISDLHFGRIDHRVVEGLLADLIHKGPDLIVISGDLVQRARRMHFEQARAFLERLPFPYLVVPGNHDIPVYNVIRRFTDCSETLLVRPYCSSIACAVSRQGAARITAPCG